MNKKIMVSSIFVLLLMPMVSSLEIKDEEIKELNEENVGKWQKGFFIGMTKEVSSSIHSFPYDYTKVESGIRLFPFGQVEEDTRIRFTPFPFPPYSFKTGSNDFGYFVCGNVDFWVSS